MFPRDILGGPVVKNLSSNVGNMGSIPGWGTKIPHTIGQLSLHVTTREDCTLQQRVHMLQQRASTVKKNVFPESINIMYMCEITANQIQQVFTA